MKPTHFEVITTIKMIFREYENANAEEIEQTMQERLKSRHFEILKITVKKL